jgi:hypothetical protein
MAQGLPMKTGEPITRSRTSCHKKRNHRFTVGSLLEAKEDRLERTLWSASLLLEQLSFAYEDLPAA